MENDQPSETILPDVSVANQSEPSDAFVQTPPPFRANEFDLTAAGALASAALMLGLCLTCNLGMYCLPFLPLVLGVLGIVLAPRALNPPRARTWSGIALGVGIFILLLLAVLAVVYIAFVVTMVSMGNKFD